MLSSVVFEAVENKIVTINQNQVLIDLDVADLYGVETYSKIKQLSRRVKELLNIQDRVEKSIESDPIGFLVVCKLFN